LESGKKLKKPEGNAMFGSTMIAKFVSPKTGEEIELLFSPPIDEAREAKIFASWFNDNRVKQYLSMAAGMTESSEMDWIRKQLEDKEHLNWIVYIKDKAIGSLGLNRIDMKNRNAELGICIGDKTYWGKGVATVMEVAILEYVFENVVAGGMHKVYARVFSGNIASQKVLEKKVGFRTIGYRKDEIWFNGAWHDEWNGELLAKEWKVRREKVIKEAGVTIIDIYPGCEKS
jgi:RimJ/RimL family protein N-acetyltransferase